jgi:hypothetical protein
MSKLKRNIYNRLSQYVFRLYLWLDKKYWDEHDKLWNPLDEKKENTDRIISNMKSNEEFFDQVAELFDVPAHMIHSPGHNHKKENETI